MQAYCVKCRKKQEIKSGKSVSINKRTAISGVCGTCGTKMFVFQKKQSKKE